MVKYHNTTKFKIVYFFRGSLHILNPNEVVGLAEYCSDLSSFLVIDPEPTKKPKGSK